MDLSKPASVTTSVQLSTRTGTQPAARRQDPSEPYRILLLGDFSGAGLTQPSEQDFRSLLGQDWRAWRVDIDNREEILQKLAPRLYLPIGEEVTEITFTSLDDFHPDGLFARLPLFQQLRTWRRQLLNSDTFPRAAEEVRQWAGQEKVPTAKSRDTEPNQEQQYKSESDRDEAVGSDLLDELLTRPVSDLGRGDISKSETAIPNRQVAESWEAAIRKMVLPYCVEDVSPDRDALVTVVDEAAMELMRMLLHDHRFQQLESLWRGIDWFLREELDEDSPVQVYVADCSWSDLQFTLGADAGRPFTAEEQGGDGQTEAMTEEVRDRLQRDAARRLKKLLLADAETTSGPARWQLIAGLYHMKPDAPHVLSLKRLGKWLEQFQTPFISAASSEVLGCDPADPPGRVDDWPPVDSETAERWEALRQEASMRWLGLIWPRFLLRLPYGRRTAPCDALPLEERSSSWRHGDYLWGNPAFLWAAATAQEVARRAAGEESPELVEFGGMPVDVYLDDGEMVAHPCTEAWVGEREVDRLLSVGVMPVLSVRGTDRVRLTSFRSLAGIDQFTL